MIFIIYNQQSKVYRWRAINRQIIIDVEAVELGFSILFYMDRNAVHTLSIVHHGYRWDRRMT
jgi:hypothetical protein